jgi:hypothetical protein
MTRSDRRRQLRAERIAARSNAAAERKREIAKRKILLRKKFLDRHNLRLSFWEKLRLVLAILFAAVGGPLYPWLPDSIRLLGLRRK